MSPTTHVTRIYITMSEAENNSSETTVPAPVKEEQPQEVVSTEKEEPQEQTPDNNGTIKSENNEVQLQPSNNGSVVADSQVSGFPKNTVLYLS